MSSLGSSTGSDAQWMNTQTEAPMPTEAPAGSVHASVSGSNMNALTEIPTEAPADPPTISFSGSDTDAPVWTDPPTNAPTPAEILTQAPPTWTPQTETPMTDAPASISASGSSDESLVPVPTTSTPVSTTSMPTPITSAPTPEPTPESTPWSPPPIPNNPSTTNPTPSESSGSDSFSSAAGFSDSPSSSQTSESTESSNTEDHITFSPPPVTSTPQTQGPTTTSPPSGSSSSMSEGSSDVSSSSGSGKTTVLVSESSSGSSDTPLSPPPVTWSPAPVTNPPKTTVAPSTTPPTTTGSDASSNSGGEASSGSSDSSESGTGVPTSASSGSAMSTDENEESTPSPAPVTRAPTVSTDSTDDSEDGNDVSQVEQTEQTSDYSSSDSTTPSPAPITRNPSSMVMTMPPSAASSDSVGTVIPADTSYIDNSAAEAVTKQTDSGSSDEGDKNTINGNNLVLLGDTGSTIVYTDGSKITTFEKYNRGDGDLQALEDASGSYSNIVVGGGNRANLPPGASISLSTTSQEIQNALLYASYALGIVSTVLLMFFHMLALQRPPWLGGSSDNSQDGGNGRASMGWFTPNVWELAVVVGYIQHVNSISMLDLTKAPQIVLDFTDSFSFANMHISSVTTTAASDASRRLQLIILTGIVAFADRVGIEEDEALMAAFYFFLAVVAIVLVLFALAAGFAFYHHSMSVDVWSAFYPTGLRNSFAMCVVGFGVALWMLSVFPLVSMSSYELVMELRYRVGIGLAVALFSLWAVVVGGLCYAFVSVRAIPNNDAFRFKHFAVWGSLYGDSKMAFRYFFVVTVGFQGLLGVITGAVSGIPTQLVALMVTHLLFVVVALIIRPFAARWVLGVVVGLRVVAITNLLCSFAFLTSSELSTHWRGIVAQGFVIFNAIVFFLFFARYVAMFVLVLKRWSGYTHRESFSQSQQQSYEMEQQMAGSSSNDQTPVFLTYDVREHRHHNDGGRFIASGAGFEPSRGPGSGYSSGYSSEYSSDRHRSIYSSGHSSHQHAPTPSGSSGYSSGSRAHGQSRYYH
ncbi:Transient receptor potential channel domain-containing protein [Phytophthora infestans]|uniref:Transient receptor potential channel domain-containing protein n=1 Tax=Phytophthora infestans TaxID=4787 RepID=A0A8S9V156_PHYIN|nr:Transient receptor potential channel domain-containing protein [Phytophthora infestans]